ncbi:MAG: hypothetical protein GSR83_03530 [Desulfurococcales archaeon]|nr:hypothetical protein [Desulfurococcales archaeon]
MVLDVVIYSLLQAVMTISLVLSGETRWDVYVSLSIMVYFVSTSILPGIREKSNLRLLDIFLIIVFSVIVTIKIAEILGYEIPGLQR